MTKKGKKITIIPVSKYKTGLLESKNVRSIKEELINVAAYCRVSSSSEEQRMSYEFQKKHYEEKIRKNPSWNFVGVYSDVKSGLNADNREGLMQLLKQCEMGKVDYIITKSISRFGRNTLDSLQIARKLRQMNIGIYFEQQNIDTLTMDSETLFVIHASLAQENSERISNDVKWGLRKRYLMGLVPYRPLYGYDKGEISTYKINQEKAQVVRMIFDRYIEGISLQRISNELYEKKILSPKKKERWESSSILNIILNEKYCGDVICQKTYVKDFISKKTVINNGELEKIYIKDNHPPIVSRERFEEAKAEYVRRICKRKISSRAKTEQRKYSSLYALTEILYCGECGKQYKRVTWTMRDNTKKNVWRCINRLENGKKCCKISPTLEECKLQKGILQSIQSQLEGEDGRKILSQSIKEHLSGEGQRQYAVIDYRIKQLKEKREKLISECSSDNMIKYIEIFKTISDEIKELETRRNELEGMALDEKNENVKLKQCLKYINDFETPMEYDDIMVRQLIEKIRVDSKEKITILYKGGIVDQIKI